MKIVTRTQSSRTEPFSPLMQLDCISNQREKGIRLDPFSDPLQCQVAYVMPLVGFLLTPSSTPLKSVSSMLALCLTPWLPHMAHLRSASLSDRLFSSLLLSYRLFYSLRSSSLLCKTFCVKFVSRPRHFGATFSTSNTHKQTKTDDLRGCEVCVFGPTHNCDVRNKAFPKRFFSGPLRFLGHI